MTDPVITIEVFSPDLMAAYHRWELERVTYGADAVNWTFGEQGKPFAVAREGERLIGLSGNIHQRMKFGERTGVGYQAVDSFVAPEMRGKGLFLKLAQTFADQAHLTGADLVWGFPNDNASHAWFNRLDWRNHGQVPFLIKPLRASYFLRRLRLSGDFPLTRGRDQNLTAADGIGTWADDGWAGFSRTIGCARIRDQEFLTRRLFEGPHKDQYRVVCDPGTATLVATREMDKHGARIAYVMEAMGQGDLKGMLTSEMARLRDRDAEIALAWALPGSPNYGTLREAGFLPFPPRLRPINIWFGARAVPGTSSMARTVAQMAHDRKNWYLSYLDSDTV